MKSSKAAQQNATSNNMLDLVVYLIFDLFVSPPLPPPTLRHSVTVERPQFSRSPRTLPSRFEISNSGVMMEPAVAPLVRKLSVFSRSVVSVLESRPRHEEDEFMMFASSSPANSLKVLKHFLCTNSEACLSLAGLL